MKKVVVIVLKNLCTLLKNCGLVKYDIIVEREF